MKVIFDHNTPYSIAHGGFAAQIDQTKLALEQLGVQVDYMRWWESEQPGDLIHYFGRPWHQYVVRGQQKGYKIIMSDLFTGLGSRSLPKRAIQKGIMSVAQRVMGESLLI